jgi:putative addiction module killer protein
MIANEKHLIPYTTKDGKQPIIEWLSNVDTRTRMIVLTRLQRVRLGNLGDCPFVKGNDSDLIRELRFIDHGGTRIYIREHGKNIIIFLAGGNKDSQHKDIIKVKEYWKDHKSRNPEITRTIFEVIQKDNKGDKNEKV